MDDDDDGMHGCMRVSVCMYEMLWGDARVRCFCYSRLYSVCLAFGG